MTVQGGLWLAKRLSLNIIICFLNRISLILISSSYPIVLTRLDGPRSRPYSLLPEKFPGYSRELNPGPLGWQSNVITTIPNRWSEILLYDINKKYVKKIVFTWQVSSPFGTSSDVMSLLLWCMNITGGTQEKCWSCPVIVCCQELIQRRLQGLIPGVFNLLSSRANLHLSYNPAGRRHCRLQNHHEHLNIITGAWAAR